MSYGVSRKTWPPTRLLKTTNSTPVFSQGCIKFLGLEKEIKRETGEKNGKNGIEGEELERIRR